MQNGNKQTHNHLNMYKQHLNYHSHVKFVNQILLSHHQLKNKKILTRMLYKNARSQLLTDKRHH